MKKIIVIKSLARHYTEIQGKLKRHQKLIDVLKVSGVAGLLLFTLGVYLYYVNASSTQGYFLRQEMNNLDKVKFDYNIMALEVLKHQKSLWDNVQVQDTKNFGKNNAVKIDDRVVFVPLTDEYAFKQ